jgi:hypothetical protein
VPTICIVTDCPDAERLVAALVPRERQRHLIVDPDPARAARRLLDWALLMGTPTRRGLPPEPEVVPQPEYVRAALVPLPLADDDHRVTVGESGDGDEDDTDLWQVDGGEAG